MLVSEGGFLALLAPQSGNFFCQEGAGCYDMRSDALGTARSEHGGRERTGGS